MQGRLLTFASLTSDGMGLTQFIAQKLKPLLATRFAGLTSIVVGDPAGSQRAQTDERSCFDILRAAGFKTVPARTNSVVARIAAVDTFLNRQVEGGPGCLFDPSAREIINALRGGYRYKMKKNGEHEDKPEKNEYSHVADAHQYACLHADNGLRGSDTPARREIVAVASAGWT